MRQKTKNTFKRLKGDVIGGSTKYILCTRHKSLHRKALAVCLKCRYRSDCEDFQKAQPPELMQEFNKLRLALDARSLKSDLAEAFKKELSEIKDLC